LDATLSSELSDNDSGDDDGSEVVDRETSKHDDLHVFMDYRATPILCHLNVQSLLPKIDEVRAVVLDARRPVILGLSETWLDGSIDSGEVDIPSFILYRWFSDNATAGGHLQQLHEWWTKLNRLGPAFGYLANSKNSWLIVKEQHLPRAKEMFGNTGVNITTEGKRHLGAALGSRSFVVSYMQDKVKEWTSSIMTLATIAKTQPHAAYSAFTHGLASKWTYFLRTIPDISDLLLPLEEAINLFFIPALTGRDGISEVERQLFSLPTQLGGLSLTKPTEVAELEYTSSQKITAPLAALILIQQQEITYDTVIDQERAKTEVRQSRQ